MRKYFFTLMIGCLGLVPLLSAQQKDVTAEPLELFKPGKYEVKGSPWCAAVEGNTLYFTVTGPTFDPDETAEDGFIYSLKVGESEPKPLTKPEYLASPKGLIVEEDFLTVADVGQLYTIDKEKGTLIGYVNIGSDGPMKGISGVACMPDRLVVTCPDKNRLYFVDTISYSFGEFTTKEKIFSPSSSVWDPENKVLYVAECAESTDDRGRTTPSGRLLAVNTLTGGVRELEPRSGKPIRGMFSALALKDGELYFSDWSKDNKPEVIRKYQLKTGLVTNVATMPIQKVTGILFRGNQMIVTSAKDQCILIFNLPRK